MWDRQWRTTAWGRLDRPFDIVVIGGGITGAGIFNMAARYGLRVLLVEARDFAFGTSSRSTKLVHGGLRYLRQGQVRVTRKSVRERERLLREAPGLVDDLGFTLAAFPGDKVPRWMIGVGLAVYDTLAGKWRHERLSRDDLLELHPALRGTEVVGGYRYHDARTDDARLVLRVLQEAAQGDDGDAIALNYARVGALLRDEAGQVHGVRITDEAPGPDQGRVVEVRAKVTINATGAWVDDLRTLAGAPPRMRKIRGSHLTLPHARLPLAEALSLVHPADGRVVFAVPWEGVTIFGTTDRDHASLADEPRIADEEFDYLLAALQRAFPAQELRGADVLGTWAGVRPVIDTGKRDPSKESREHAIWQENGLLTVAGGKLTTFALMARDTLKAAEPALGRLGPRPRVFREVAAPERAPAALGDLQRARLLGRHGGGASALFALDPALFTPIDDAPLYWAELVHAARHEAVVHLDDLLLRRVRLGFLLPRGGQDHLERIRALVQPELGWDDTRWAAEAAAYARTWADAYGGR